MKRKAMLKLLDAITELHDAAVEGCMPAEARRHFRASRAEMLKGVRAVLDFAIGELERRDRPESHRRAGRLIDISD